jgi:ferritin-like metal-binding protein YciE
MNVDYDKIERFFITHLDMIYCTKSHLIVHLPELLEKAHYPELKSAILQTLDNVHTEISKMEVIYALLDSAYTEANAKGIKGYVADTFATIAEQGQDKELRDLSILFYLQNLESLEMATFQTLQMAAIKLKNRQVVTLLKENYQEAKANRTSLLLVVSKYITSGED